MKVVACRDMGADCDFVIRGETEEDILRKAAEHGRKEHGITEITPDMKKKLSEAIHEEAA